MGQNPMPSNQQSAPRRPFYDLGLRTVSGIVLAVVALGLTYGGGWGFVALVTIAAALMSWEWSRIVRGASFDAACLVHALAAAAAPVLTFTGQTLFASVGLLIAALVVLVLTFGRSTLLSCLGVFYVGLPAMALVSLRSDQAYGLGAVMFVLLVVWTVDTGAFIGGRSIGGPKLWPAVSPNKTWAGFVCGVGGGVLIGIAIALWLQAPVVHMSLVALGLGVVSQGGDLAESALKRHFGVKDASALIPGHGGVMDRVDGVVAAATLAAVIGHVANVAAPARALLFAS